MVTPDVDSPVLSFEDDLAAIMSWLWDHSELPGDVEHRARLLVLDTIGCAIAGHRKQEVGDLAGAFAAAQPGQLHLPGIQAGLTPFDAAHIVALAACWDEACEGLARAHGRPGLHAVPPVLCLAASDGGTLGEVLRAAVVGFEVGGRLGEVLRVVDGMHVDGMWGGLGAAAGVALLVGLDPAAAQEAIEAMACQMPWSQYLPVRAGATTRNLYVAEAVARALRTTLAVKSGVSAPTGAVALFSDRALATETIPPMAPPGEWLVTQGYLKPHAAVRHVHYGVDAALAWRERHGADVSAIDGITLDVYPEAITYCGNRAPSTAIQAQFSLTYGVARALIHGSLDPSAYTADALADQRVVALEAMTEVTALPDDGGRRRARLTVSTVVPSAVTPDTATDVVNESVTVDAVLGDEANPFTSEQTVEKFVRYAEPSIGSKHAARLAEMLVEAPLSTPISDVLSGLQR